MNQSFIDALMHFFSLLLLPLPGRKLSNMRLKLEEYIVKAGIGFPFEECLRIYNTYSGKYFFEFSNNPYSDEVDISEIHRRLILEAGHKSQENLLLQERLLVILSLLEFNLIFNDDNETTASYIKELCFALNISEVEYDNLNNFLYKKQQHRSDLDLILDDTINYDSFEGQWVSENKPLSADALSLFADRIKDRVHFRMFEQFNYIAFIYEGKETLYLNDNEIHTGYFYSFKRKDNLKFKGLKPIYFEEIESYFNPSEKFPKIILSGDNISYRYKKSNYSIKSFDFSEDSGQLIGIIGNNGVGKSTILKLIANRLTPISGKLLINGSDLITNSYKLKSVTGFVTQEEVFFPEISIYENLYYQASLCLGNLTKTELDNRIHEITSKLQLESVLHIKPGSEYNYKLSDFQKICFKIALEQIRKPYILFLDEPLSGLSFSDTKRLLTLLKEEVNQGKLIFLTSQLPNTEIFNMFDKIWLIDQDGYMVYNGEPSKSLSFLRNTGLLPYYFIQTRKNEISAEDVVKILETKKIQSDGKSSEERQISAGAWYDAWRSASSKNNKTKDVKKPIPIQTAGLPSIEKQFFVYLKRNFRLRLNKITYAIAMLAGLPILGFILALVIRMNFSGNYSFADNELLPLFFFISINMILLAGAISSAEEIFSEKKLLFRDLSLNLSLFSYQNSKLVFFLIISFFQSLLYAIITNITLGIDKLLIPHTLIYFSISITGNLIGLVLSSGLKKLKNIYLFIPFLLFPSIYFTGYLIPYDKTDSSINKVYSIPVIAEFSPARWAYEAIIVEQHVRNLYNKYFFKPEKDLYISAYYLDHLLPAYNSILNDCTYYKYIQAENDSLRAKINILNTEIKNLNIYSEIAPFEKLSNLNFEKYDSTLNNEIFGYLTYLQFLLENKQLESQFLVEKRRQMVIDSLNNEDINYFKRVHVNNSIAELVKGKHPEDSIYVIKDKIFKEGINNYLISDNQFGRSHFFASEKRFNEQTIPTFRYNLSLIWLINTIIYVLFLINIIKQFGLFFSQRE